MLGNQSNSNCNKPVFRNARLFGPNCNIGNNSNNGNTKSATNTSIKSSGSKNHNNTGERQNDFIEEDLNEYTKTDVPEMKLLPMEYVSKVKSKPKCPPPPPPSSSTSLSSSSSKIPKCKCTPPNDTKPRSGLKVTINAPESSAEKGASKMFDNKYLVYKQKHSIFGTSKDILNGKLKYVNDNDKSSVDAVIQDTQKVKEGRRKYLLFDSKKNNSSKFETIQYYFDNKSYERYVDTKLYGKLNQISNPQPILKNNNSSSNSTNNNANNNSNIKNNKNKIADIEEEEEEKENDDDNDDKSNGIDDIDISSDIDMKGFENSRSWEYRDNAKTESKLKLFESKQNKKQQQELNSKKSQIRSSKSEDSCSGNNISGASSCSDVLLKRQNCRLKPQQKLTISKSIGDLTAINKTSHDVKRINQLFENAKQSQVTISSPSALKSNVDNNNKEKYKIHKFIRDDSNVIGDRGNLCRENVKKYHRSSTDLNIKTPITSNSKPSSCGFKNCKLSNCPISHHNNNNNNNPPSSSVLMINERRSKFDENFIRKFEDMMKNSNNTNNGCILKNNEITVNRTNVSVNGKSNIIVNDTKNNFTPSCHDVFIINSDITNANNEKELHQKANNNNKTTIKINESCFVVNNSTNNDQKLNNKEKNKNIIELSSEKVKTPSNWDKNIKVKNNPQPKFNNKIDVNNKIKNEENSVKIYVIGNDNASSPTPSAIYSTISSRSPDTCSSSDSDKDDGYYDASSQGRSSSPEFTEMFKKLRDLCNLNSKQTRQQQQKSQMKFGYDGTFFWNNSYFDEDESDFMLTTMNNNNNDSIKRKSEKMYSSSTYACTKCLTTTEDLLSNYICICRNKVENYITRPLSCEGPSDSGVSVSSENIFSPDGDNTSLTAQSQTDFESRKLKRGHVLTELLETERIYVNEMRSILTGYRDKLLSEEMQSMVPAGLQGNADILFGNLQEIYTFHSDVFLKDLENSICLTELVALCFVQRRDVFFRLYSYYCQNIPRSERLRETLVDTHLFLSECQKKLGHKLPLAAYLLKPVQRITKYQLLLKDLLKFSDSGTCTKELQKALDCMLVVLKCVNDSMHQIAITGFPADLSQQGDLLLQDSFQICSENKKDLRLRIKPQQRHVFLYQKAILFCKQDTKTGHNKSTYQFKHWLKMSQIGLTESVRGDIKRFEVWLQGRSEVHTFQAATAEIKGKWVAEIKRVLMNQLEELKDERNKQYGKNQINHRPLQQSNSVSHETPSTNVNQRTRSVDSTMESNTKRNITPPITALDDANNTWNSTGISASSSEHDNQETNAWSSDCSNSDDDCTFGEGIAVPRKNRKDFINLNAETDENRNSAQKLVETCNLSVKDRITQYQAMVLEKDSPTKTPTNHPCSIVVSNFDETNRTEGIVNDEANSVDSDASTSVNIKRQSIVSNSSIESTRSDNTNCDGDVNIEYGSSVFYVIWD